MTLTALSGPARLVLSEAAELEAVTAGVADLASDKEVADTLLGLEELELEDEAPELLLLPLEDLAPSLLLPAGLLT